MLDAGEHDAQGHSRKDVGIVALARLKPLPVQLKCGERRPRGEHTASLAPSVSLCSSKFIEEGLEIESWKTFTPSLAFKGHGIQGSLVKILPKIRVILVVN